jgi:hypothetical protein
VVTFTGNFSGYAFNGTYKINGGCDAGDQGTLTGINVWNIGNDLSGTFRAKDVQRCEQNR